MTLIPPLTILARYEKLEKDMKAGLFNKRYATLRPHKQGKVMISDLSRDFCEQAYFLESQNGRRTTPSMQAGTAAHDKLFSGIELDTKELYEQITTSLKVKVSGFPVLFVYSDKYLISGAIDSLEFVNGNPVLLREHKNRPNGRIYSSDRKQAVFYAYALQQMGFDTSALKLSITTPVSDETLLFQWNAQLEASFVKALNFWTVQRGPEFTPSFNKCSKCHMLDFCTSGQATVNAQGIGA